MGMIYSDLDTNFLNVSEQHALSTGRFKICNTARGRTLIEGNDALAYMITAAALPTTAEERLAALKSAWIVKPGDTSQVIKVDAGEILIAIAPQGDTSISITAM